jgi:hypothetical protein
MMSIWHSPIINFAEGTPMKITIQMQGTTNEFIEYSQGLEGAAKLLLETMIQNGLIEQSETIDNPKIYAVLEKVSWDIVHFAHLIYAYAPDDQVKDKGRFLNSGQLDEHGISERSASSRVGGCKRVATNIGADRILFISVGRVNQEKRYYLDANATSTLLQYLEMEDDDYREWLQDKELEYPRE